MKNDKHHDAGVSHTRHTDRNSDGARAVRNRTRPDWRALLVTLAAAVTLAAMPGVPGITGTAVAQSMIHVGATKRTAAVVVAADHRRRSLQCQVDRRAGRPRQVRDRVDHAGDEPDTLQRAQGQQRQ